MTKKLFWQDPTQVVHKTIVTSIANNQLTVASTIFYAFSGGQESDQGTIAGYQVLDARKDGFEIIYTLPENHTLEIGQSVRMEIDWPRRYKLMRLHFAAELVLELVYRRLPDIEKLGAHIAPEKARIDFAWPESIAALLAEIANQANRIIADDLEIISAFEDEATERRFWEIKGFSRVPCGGTHVKKTGEIGLIKLKRDNIGRGKERIEIYSG